VLLTGGCLTSPLPNGRAICANGKTRCPANYYCAADDTCWRDGSGPDLAVGGGHDASVGDLGGSTDLGVTPACPGLFCESFETDVASTSAISASDGKTLWNINGTVPTYAVVDIDPTSGALGTMHSLRFRLSAMQSGGLISPTYQRDTTILMLGASVPNYVRTLNGPTYTRLFVKLSAERHAAFASLNFAAGDPGDLEIAAEPDGISFNTRFNVATPLFTRNTLAVSWTGDWVCVEWENRLVNDSDAGPGLRFRSIVSVNGTVAATFEGGGTPNTAVEQLLGADQEFRSDAPNFLAFTEWIDQLVFSDQPVGCK
jgi:hypothetical protein